MDTEGSNRPMNSVQFGSHCDKHHIFFQDGGKMNEEKEKGRNTYFHDTAAHRRDSIQKIKIIY